MRSFAALPGRLKDDRKLTEQCGPIFDGLYEFCWAETGCDQGKTVKSETAAVAAINGGNNDSRKRS